MSFARSRISCENKELWVTISTYVMIVATILLTGMFVESFAETVVIFHKIMFQAGQCCFHVTMSSTPPRCWLDIRLRFHLHLHRPKPTVKKVIKRGSKDVVAGYQP
jgi:hypothetical protein